MKNPLHFLLGCKHFAVPLDFNSWDDWIYEYTDGSMHHVINWRCAVCGKEWSEETDYTRFVTIQRKYQFKTTKISKYGCVDLLPFLMRKLKTVTWNVAKSKSTKLKRRVKVELPDYESNLRWVGAI